MSSMPHSPAKAALVKYFFHCSRSLWGSCMDPFLKVLAAILPSARLCVRDGYTRRSGRP
jgi:hypothetical protein